LALAEAVQLVKLVELVEQQDLELSLSAVEAVEDSVAAEVVLALVELLVALVVVEALMMVAL
jgi:hypothetical protein